MNTRQTFWGFSLACSFVLPSMVGADTWTTSNTGKISTSATSTKVGIGLTGSPDIRGFLDVNGAVVVGHIYAGNTTITPPTNGMLIQGPVGIGTSTPANFRSLDVNGVIRGTAVEGNGIFPVQSFGIFPDGNRIVPDRTDYSAQVNTALATIASSGGGTLYFSPGQYTLNLPITIPAGVSMLGAWDDMHVAILNRGTTINTNCGNGTASGTPFITVGYGSSLKGITINYPKQVPPLNSSWAAIPFPWTIRGNAFSVLENLTLVNCYQCIDFGTNTSDGHFLRNVYMSPLLDGIVVDHSTEIGRMENVHMNPNIWHTALGASTPQATIDLITAYTTANVYGFQFGRTDWEHLNSCFAFGTKVGMNFFGLLKANGDVDDQTLATMFVENSGIDQSQIAIYVDAVQNAPWGASFSNCAFVGGISISPHNAGPIRMENCWFTQSKTGSSDLIVKQGTGTLSLSNCNIAEWGNTVNNTAAIKIFDGVAIIQGCQFTNTTAAALAPPVAAVSSTGALNFIGNRVAPYLAPTLIQYTTGSIINESATIRK